MVAEVRGFAKGEALVESAVKKASIVQLARWLSEGPLDFVHDPGMDFQSDRHGRWTQGPSVWFRCPRCQRPRAALVHNHLFWRCHTCQTEGTRTELVLLCLTTRRVVERILFEVWR